MGIVQSKEVTPVPKLTFPNFNQNTEHIPNEIASQAVSKSIVSKGEWLASKLPSVGIVSVEVNIAKYFLQIINFLISLNPLDEALIAAKIDAAVATQATAHLRAEIKAIQASINILKGRITKEERIHEVKIAETGCRRVLNSFSGSGCFRKCPLESATVLFPFALIYVEIVKSYLLLDPSPAIRRHLRTVMTELQETLVHYKSAAVEQRMAGIIARSGASGPGIPYQNLKDNYRSDFTPFSSAYCSDYWVKVAVYRTSVRKLYEDHFNGFVQVVNNFCAAQFGN